MKIPKLLLLLSLFVIISSCKDDEDYPTYDPMEVTVEGLKVETPGEFVKTANIPASGVDFDFVVVFNKKIDPIDKVIVNGKHEFTREDGMNPEVMEKSWELQMLNGGPDYKYAVKIYPNTTGEERIFKIMLGKGRDYAKIRLTQDK